MGSLFGNKGTKGNQSSAGGAQQTSSTVQNSSGQQSSNSYNSSNAVSNSQSSTDPGFMTELQKVLNNQLAGTTGFTKQDAINDVQGTLKQQASDALQSVMPTIARTEKGAGVYNSTTKDLLQNDANARITSQLAATTQDQIAKYAQIEQGLIGAFSGATQAGTSQSSTSNSNSTSLGTATSQGTQSASSVSQGQSTEWNQGQNKTSGGGSGLLGLFADGGQVPTINPADEMLSFFDNFLASSGLEATGQKAAAMAANPSAQSVRDTMKSAGSIDTKIEDYLIDSIFSSIMGFSEGGKVPEGKTSPDQELLAAIQKYRDGGKVRSGEEDVQKGGKIQGKQSPTGEDNQVIGVAGGEGIIAKDVMQQPGVAQLVEFLNSKFHKPV